MHGLPAGRRRRASQEGAAGRLISMLAIVALPHAAAQPEIAGERLTPGLNARVRIEACGDAVCGRIVWLWDETPKDVEDKSPLVGKAVIDRMRSAEPGRWSGGRLYNPEDGRYCKGTRHLQVPNRLVIDGCVLFVCRTRSGRRSDPGRCPPVAPL
jgi:uncharacterized protein (DUF2147 family)